MADITETSRTANRDGNWLHGRRLDINLCSGLYYSENRPWNNERGGEKPWNDKNNDRQWNDRNIERSPDKPWRQDDQNTR